MPIANIVPSSSEIEDSLAERIEEIRSRLKATICRISDFPPHDVLINLAYCPYRDADPDAADLVVFIDTCPHDELEAKAEELYTDVADDLCALGFTVGNGAEVWPRFLPGPWCLVRNGEIVDSVSHPRTK